MGTMLLGAETQREGLRAPGSAPSQRRANSITPGPGGRRPRTPRPLTGPRRPPRTRALRAPQPMPLLSALAQARGRGLRVACDRGASPPLGPGTQSSGSGGSGPRPRLWQICPRAAPETPTPDPSREDAPESHPKPGRAAAWAPPGAGAGARTGSSAPPRSGRAVHGPGRRTLPLPEGPHLRERRSVRPLSPRGGGSRSAESPRHSGR